MLKIILISSLALAWADAAPTPEADADPAGFVVPASTTLIVNHYSQPHRHQAEVFISREPSRRTNIF